MDGLGDLRGRIVGGRYQLGDKLGQGGMGAVYAAVQSSLGRRVAIKVLLPLLSNDASLVARFRGEAEQAARLNHPNIVNVYDFGQDEDGGVWIAMELLEGEALADRMERGPMSEADVVTMAKATLAGLEAAHAVPLVHRDLKPDNIFIAKTAGVGDIVKILDFGIAKLLDGDAAAKLTATGLIIGTPLYMSPEQARGEEVDRRSDLYSLGAVMYEALTGRPPFVGRNYNALLVAVLTEKPQPILELRPNLHPALAAAVMRAVDKDRTLRFASAAEMSRALSSFTPSDEIPTGGPEALGLASTMATPQPREVTPTRPADTPPLGGTGAHSPALVSPAATTEPMTDIPARSAVAAKPARRHGWLMPSMALVALLAGVGGTYAFMSASSDAATVAVAAAPGSVTAPGYATATTTTGSAVAVGNGAATVTPIQPLEPVQVPAAPVSNDPVAANDLENTPPEPPARPAPARPATRRAPDVRIRAQLTSMAGHREWRSAGNLLSHYEWSRCWPRGMAFPERNWGVNIKADTTPDGALSNFAVAGDGVSNYPEICRCLLSHLPGASVGPSQTGSGGEITIGFGFENRSRID